MYIQMEDHRGEDGNIDWTSYKKAQKANGEYCDKCGSHIMFGGKGYTTYCHQCNGLYDKSTLVHNSLIRCPKCMMNFSAFECDYELMSEGEHSVNCIECDHFFEVTTSIQYTFHSPSAGEEQESREDEEEEDI